MAIEVKSEYAADKHRPGLRTVNPWIWGAAAVASIALLWWLNHINPSPGLERLEFAGSRGEAQSILTRWAKTGQIASARRVIWWDFLLIPSYATTIGFLIRWGYARFRSPGRTSWRHWAVGLLFVGVTCDLAENGLFFSVLGSLVPSRVLPWVSLVKFTGVGLAALIGLVVALHRVAMAIDEYLNRNERVGRTQLAAAEQSRPAAGWRIVRLSVWRRLLAWLVGALRPIPIAAAPEPVGDTPRNVGICLSGGGIRSAAFNLGALQSLQKEGILRDADYLSAVSGGAYIASCFALMHAHTDPALLAQVPAFASDSPEATYLLNHSAYLAPAGFSGKIWMILRTLLGISVNLAFVAAPLFILGTLLGWWYRGEFLHPFTTRSASLPIDSWRWIVIGGPAALGALLVAGDLFSHPTSLVYRLLRTWSKRLLGLAAAIALILVGLPGLVYLTFHAEDAGFNLQQPSIPTAGVLGMLAGAIQAFVGKRKALFAMLAGGVIAPATLLIGLVLFTKSAVGDGPTEAYLWLLGIVALAFLIGYLLSDLTTWSPHPLYKRALWGAFGLRRVKGPKEPVAQRIPYDDNVPLASLPLPDSLQSEERRFPELIICAAANVADEGATPPGRSATSFTFSPREVGGRVTGWLPTSQYEAMLWPDSRLMSVNSAVAISGAAISPSMGKMTKRPIRFLMALLNIRLGVWLPNPLWKSWWQELVQRISEGGRGSLIDRLRTRPRPRFLLREALGQNRLNSRFLYVSDGGHYENLGLVELVRRGCTDIFCFDASGDQVNTFETLGQAIALARTDYQAEISFDPKEINKLKQNSEGYSELDFVRGDILYHAVDEDPRKGTLFYAKALVTEKSPLDVKSFKATDKRFPNHSTMDQFFNERKFEAYRALGADIARRIAGSGNAKPGGPTPRNTIPERSPRAKPKRSAAPARGRKGTKTTKRD